MEQVFCPTGTLVDLNISDNESNLNFSMSEILSLSTTGNISAFSNLSIESPRSKDAEPASMTNSAAFNSAIEEDLRSETLDFRLPNILEESWDQEKELDNKNKFSDGFFHDNNINIDCLKWSDEIALEASKICRRLSMPSSSSIINERTDSAATYTIASSTKSSFSSTGSVFDSPVLYPLTPRKRQSLSNSDKENQTVLTPGTSPKAFQSLTKSCTISTQTVFSPLKMSNSDSPVFVITDDEELLNCPKSAFQELKTNFFPTSSRKETYSVESPIKLPKEVPTTREEAEKEVVAASVEKPIVRKHTYTKDENDDINSPNKRSRHSSGPSNLTATACAKEQEKITATINLNRSKSFLDAPKSKSRVPSPAARTSGLQAPTSSRTTIPPANKNSLQTSRMSFTSGRMPTTNPTLGKPRSGPLKANQKFQAASNVEPKNPLVMPTVQRSSLVAPSTPSKRISSGLPSPRPTTPSRRSLAPPSLGKFNFVVPVTPKSLLPPTSGTPGRRSLPAFSISPRPLIGSKKSQLPGITSLSSKGSTKSLNSSNRKK